ncbi:MAG: hypothetical protein ACNA77_08215 [Opitutales bacterium]
MQRAGLALAGIFTLSAASKSGTSKSASPDAVGASAVAAKSNPFRRIRPARGAVQREV